MSKKARPSADARHPRFGLLALLAVIALVGFWSTGGMSRALEAVPPDAVPSLDGRVELLLDPSRQMTLDDVLSAEASFQPVRGSGINLGYTRAAAWLRLRIHGSRNGTALLALTPNFVDVVDVYVAEDDLASDASNFRHFAFGDQRPLPADGLSGLDDIAPIDLRAGRDTLVFVRAAGSNSSLNISASLHSQTQHTQEVTSAALLSGLWLGSMAALLVTQLVFYYFDRKSFYALLALSTLGAMLVYTGNLGLSRFLLFPNGGSGNDVFLATSVWFGLAASSLAAPSILELPGRYPCTSRIILSGVPIGVLGMVFAVLGLNLVFAPFGAAAALGLATLAMAVSIPGAAARGTGARLRAAAYTILWIGAVATLVQRAGFWPMPNWTAHSYAVSCLIQTLLLTASLAVRLRAVEATNRAVVADALAASRTSERRAVERVEERTRELAAAKKVAEDALRAELHAQERQVRFMEVISHQYRTPLASIRSNVDAIGLSLSPTDTQNRERIDRIRRGILRLVETLEINLARSRLQGSRFAPCEERLSCADFAGGVAARARDFLQGEIVVEIDPAAETAHIVADSEMLGVAVLNLLENAVKFSAQTAGAGVRLSCRVEKAKAVFSVQDRGIGIPAHEIDGVLDRFVRGSNASSIEGSGMGLSLVSRIVASHKGDFRLESSAGVGTTASIALPLAPN